MPQFQIGLLAQASDIRQQILDALLVEAQGDADRYDVQTLALPGAAQDGRKIVRVSFTNKETGRKETADVAWGESLGNDLGRSIHLMFHGGRSAGVISSQIEPVLEGERGMSFQAPRPAQLLTRGLLLATESAESKSLTEIFSRGVPGRIAAQAHDDELGSIPVSGKMMGIPGYAGQSLQSLLSSSVPVLMPQELPAEKQGQVVDAIQTSLAYGELGRHFWGYGLKLGVVPRLLRGAFDVRERVVDEETVDENGTPTTLQRVERTYFQSIGGPKEYKHGQAAVGERREEAIPVDPTGKPIQPGVFNLELAKNAQGVWEAQGFNPYVELQTRYPWQQTADPETGREAAPAKRVLAGLTYIPTGMPFGSGSARVDTDLYNQVAGFAIEQYKPVALSGIRSMEDLRKAVFNLDPEQVIGREVAAGRGAERLGSVALGEEEQEIALPRAARDLTVAGLSLSIAPYYLPKSRGGVFSADKAPGAISTERLAQQLSQRLGLRVTTGGRETPEILVDYRSQVGGSPKDIGFKAGFSPLMYGQLTADLPSGERVRVHQMSAEVKSMPMAFSTSFALQPLEKQIRMVRRLGAEGEQLAAWMQTAYPPGGQSDLEQITRQWSQIRTGRPDELNWLQFSEALLGTFKTDRQKLRSLKEYGIAFLDRPQWVYGDILSAGEVREYQEAQRAMVESRLTSGNPIAIRSARGGEKTYTDASQTDEVLNKLFRYQPVQTAPGQEHYRFSFWSHEGLIAPIGTQIAPEMTGWGTLNYRQIASLTERFPETARLLGISATDLPTTRESDPAKQAWAQVKKWETYDLEARSGRTLVVPGRDDVLVVGGREASEIYSKLYATGKSMAALSDEARMRKVQDVMQGVYGERFSPEKMLYFKAATGFLPGTGTILHTDIYDQLTGESGAKYSLSWMAAFEKSLHAQTGGISPQAATADLKRFRSLMNRVLEGKGVSRHVFGYDAPGSIFARYTGMSALNPGELFLPERELRRMVGEIPGLSRGKQEKFLRQLTGGYTPEMLYAAATLDRSGLESYLRNTYAGAASDRVRGWADDLSAAQQNLADAYLPGFGLRQPDVSREYGVLPMQIITAHQLAARGVRPPPSGWVDAGVSSMFSTVGVGDEDRDPLQAFLSVMVGSKGARAVETDEMKKYYYAYQLAHNELVDVMGTNDTFGVMQQLFGGEANAYHILRSSVEGYLKTFPGEGGKIGKSALTAGTGGRRVPLMDYLGTLEQWGEQKSSMGRVYNMLRMLEASNATLGQFSPENFGRRVFDPMQLYYQKALDMSLEESVPMMNILGTIRAFKRTSDNRWYAGFSVRGDVGSSDQPDSEKNFDWISPMHSGQNPNYRVMLQSFVQAVGAEKTLRDETLSFLFAPNQEAALNNIQALEQLKALKSSNPDQWGNVTRADVLLGNRALPGVANAPEVSERSNFYTAAMARMAWRSLGDAEKYAEVRANADQISFPWLGQERSLVEIAEDPLIFLSNLMYRYQTMGETNVPAGMLVRAIDRMRKLSGGPLTPERIGQMPTLAKSMTSYMRMLLGEDTFSRMGLYGGDLEKRYVSLASRRAESVYREAMDLSLKAPPVLWASTLASYLDPGKRQAWRPLEQMVAQRVFPQSPAAAEGGQTLMPSLSRQLLKDLFPGPSQALAERGTEFEHRWQPNVPGMSGNTTFFNTGSERSLVYGYGGAEVHFKPDWIGWDAENRKLNLVEHKMTAAENAKYGQYQVTLNAIGMRELAKTDPGRQQLFEYFRDLEDASGNRPFEQSAQEIVSALQDPEAIQTWLVAAEKGNAPQSGSYVYTAPVATDWQAVEREVIQPGLRPVVSLLQEKEKLTPIAQRVVEEARKKGYHVQAMRRYFGMEYDPNEVVRPGAGPGTAPVGAQARRPGATSAGTQFSGTASGRGGSAPGGSIPPSGGSGTGVGSGGGGGRSGATAGFMDDDGWKRLQGILHEEIQGMRPMLGGPPRDPQLAQDQALSALYAASAYNANPQALGLEEEIVTAIAPILGVTPTPGQTPFGSLPAAVFEALKRDQTGATEVLKPYFQPLEKFGRLFERVKKRVYNEGYVRSLGIDVDTPDIQTALSTIFGNEDGAPDMINQQLSGYYQVSSMLGHLGITSRAAGGGGRRVSSLKNPVLAQAGYLTDQATALDFLNQFAGVFGPGATPESVLQKADASDVIGGIRDLTALSPEMLEFSRATKGIVGAAVRGGFEGELDQTVVAYGRLLGMPGVTLPRPKAGSGAPRRKEGRGAGIASMAVYDFAQRSQGFEQAFERSMGVSLADFLETGAPREDVTRFLRENEGYAGLVEQARGVYSFARAEGIEDLVSDEIAAMARMGLYLPEKGSRPADAGYLRQFDQYARVNHQAMDAFRRLNQLTPDTSARARSTAEREAQRTNLESNLAREQLGLRKEQMTFEKAFEETGVGTPVSLQDITTLGGRVAAGDLTLSETQTSALEGVKGSLDRVEVAGGKLEQFDVSRQVTDRMRFAVDATIGHLEKLTKAHEEYNKELDKGFKGTTESKKELQDIKVSQAEQREKVIAEAMGEVLGMAPGTGGTPQQMRGRALERIRALSARGSSRTDLDIAEQEKLEGLYEESLQADTTTRETRAVRQVSQQEAGWGGVLRRALGGFGLMYARSMLARIGETTGFGYQQALQEEQQIAGVMGASFGGVTPPLNPEEYVKRLEAGYGGSGTRAQRTLYGDILKKAPGLVGMGQAVEAAGIGYASTIWLSSLGSAAAGLAPLAPFVAGAAAAYSLGTNIYGAYKDTDTTTANIASRFAQGRLEQAQGGPNDFRLTHFSDVFTSMFDTTLWGYYFGRDKMGPEVRMLDEMRQRAQDNPQANLRLILSALGVKDSGEQNRYIERYTRVEAENYPRVPLQGLVQATTMEETYGFRLGRGEGGQYEKFATALAQGVPIVETAAGMLAGTGWSPAAVNLQMGNTLQGLIGVPTQQSSLWQQGARRQESLGPWGELPPGMSREELEARYGALNQLSTRGYDLFARDVQITGTRAAMGLAARQPEPQEYAKVYTDQEYAKELEARQRSQMLTQAQQSVYSSYSQLGLPTSALMPGTENLPLMQLQQMGQQGQAAIGIGQRLMQGGMEFGQVQEAAGALALMNPQDFSRYQGVLDFNPLRMAEQALRARAQGAANLGPGIYPAQQVNQTNPFTFNQAATALLMRPVEQTVEGINGQQIPISALLRTDYNEQTGQLTGLPWGTTSLAIPGMYTSAQMANNIWGSDWRTSGQYSSGLIQALIQGGTRAGQLYQMNLGYQNQMAGFAIQEQQFALQQRYQPQFWALQDQQRQQGYAQQEWQFDFQQRQLDLQNRWFGENQALNRQQTTMQRQWSREDWGYQDEVRALQWGWKQEDFAENIRFTTGRQRRLSERQMQRDTILHDLEEGQVDKQKQRQQELWKLEDRRFELQKKQHDESVKMQQEQLGKSRQFFEERKKLDEQLVKLQRQEWQESMELQKKAMAQQKAYAEEMHKVQLTMLKLQQNTEDANGQLNLLSGKSLADLVTLLKDADPLFKTYIERVKALNDALKEGGSGGSGGSSGAPHGASGLDLIVPPGYARDNYPVFASSGERVTITPSYRANRTSPWNDSTMPPERTAGGNSQPIVVNLHVGNELLKRFVINAVSQDLTT
jgi:hypothetical protein